MDPQTKVSLVSAALEAKNRGWEPLRVPLRSKNPGRKNWQEERVGPEAIPEVFARPGNIGVLTGEPSQGLTDVDLDCPEAITCAPEFLPPTDRVHGRASKPRSHQWYITSPVPGITQWKDIGGQSLLELRGTGGHTLIPPSVHPKGETLTWDSTGEPLRLPLHELMASCTNLAVATLLARHWPEEGSRHDVALAVAGFLLRGGVPVNDVAKIVEVAARVAGDEEWQERGGDAVDTARNMAKEVSVTGGTTMATLLLDGDRVTQRLQSWLGLESTSEQHMEWEPPQPFVDASGPAFPLEVFPEPTRGYVEAVAEGLQVPIDLPGCLALAVAAAASAKKCIIRLDAGWTEPLNLYVVAVLPSGERKSPTFREVTAPLELREQELLTRHVKELAKAKAQADILVQQLKAAKTMASKEKDADERIRLTKEAEQLAVDVAEVTIPTSPRLIADDATPEAVASLLAEHGERIAVMSSEGGPFEMMKGRYSNHVPNIEVYMKGYSGDPLRVDRKGRPTEIVKAPALTVGLTVQPVVLQGLAGQKESRGKGLYGRFLYSVPHSLVGFRSNQAAPTPDHLRSLWGIVIKNILILRDHQEGEEHTLVLSADAMTRFLGFRDEVEVALRPGADLHPIVDWGNKLCGSVARLAGVLHLLKHFTEPTPWDIEVADNTMERAIQLGRYFEGHAHVAFGMMGAEIGVERARGLWVTIDHLGLDAFSRREIYQHVRRRLSTDELGEALNILTEMGYIRPLPSMKGKGAGRPASVSYEVNPLASREGTADTTLKVNFVDSEDIVYASEGSDFSSDDPRHHSGSHYPHPTTRTQNPQNTQNSEVVPDEDIGEV